MGASEACYLHGARPAAGTCQACGRPACERCLRVEAGRRVCPACVGAARRRARLGRLGRLIAAAVLLAAGAGGWWLVTRQTAPAVAPETVAEALAITRSRPTDPAAWLRLGDLYLAADQYRDAASAYARARTLRPGDPVAAARFGFARYAEGDNRAAEQALTEAARLGSEDMQVIDALEAIRGERARERAAAKARTAARRSAEEARDRARTEAQRARAAADEAKALARAAEAEARTAEAKGRHEESRTAAGCPLEVHRDATGTLKLTVNVDGADLELVVDTGATRTLLTAEAAARAGLEIASDRYMEAQTAAGPVQLSVGVAGTARIGGLQRRIGDVGVCDDCLGPLGDGLLGVDLQRAFEMRVDAARGRVTVPCGE